MSNTLRKNLAFFMMGAALLFIAFSIFLYYISTNSTSFSLRWDEDESKAVITAVRDESSRVRVGDTVTSLDSFAITTRSDYYNLRQALLYRQELALDVQQDGVTRTVRLSTQRWSPGLYEYGSIFLGLVFFMMGGFLVLTRPTYNVALILAYASIFLGSMFINEIREIAPVGFVSAFVHFIRYSSGTIALAFLLHFSLVFPKPKISKQYIRLRLLAYALPILLLALSLINYSGIVLVANMSLTPFAEIDSFLNFTGLFYLLSYFMLTVIFLIRTYFRTSEKSDRARIRWIIIGLSIPLLYAPVSVLYNNLFPSPNVTLIQWLYLLTAAVLPATFIYAIVRHKAMDIEMLVRRGLVYSLISGIVVVVSILTYLVVFVIPPLWLGSGRISGGVVEFISNLLQGGVIHHITLAGWAFVTFATVNHTRERVQEFIDGRFHRKRYDYRRELQRLGAVLEKATSNEQLMEIVLDTGARMVQAGGGTMVITDKDGNVERCGSLNGSDAAGLFEGKSIHALHALFDDGKRYVLRGKLYGGQPGSTNVVKSIMDSLDAEICLSMQSMSHRIGYIFLEEKLSELDYYAEDIELLQVLADQSAAGVERLRLVAETATRERIQQELELGREIQRSLLPDSPPAIEGASIAALNLPAMVVGGDFYTFIKYGPSKVGIIIGDITGKGVSGALKMSATLSALRLIASRNDSVSEVMNRLNEHLHVELAARSFAAALFAVLDLDAMTLSWCNAGLPDPILIASDGRAKFLEQEKYPLPLGASQRSVYTARSIAINEGDTFVFITDGAVEATNVEKDEGELGFDGLLESLSGIDAEEPEVLLAELKKRVFDFRGSELLEDDLTAIAAKIIQL